MGASHSVYIANDCAQDIYVLASLSPEWAVFDFMIDAALIFVGFTELKAAIAIEELPTTISSRDVYQNLACYAEEQREWECLALSVLDTGGYRLSAHIDDRICPTLLASDSQGEYMRVVAVSFTVVGLDIV